MKCEPVPFVGSDRRPLQRWRFAPHNLRRARTTRGGTSMNASDAVPLTQHNRSAKRCEDTNWSTRRSTWSPLRGTSRCQGTANSFHRDESTAQTHPEPHVQCQRDTVATKGRTAYTQHTQDHTHQRLYKTLRWNLASKTAPDEPRQKCLGRRFEHVSFSPHARVCCHCGAGSRYLCWRGAWRPATLFQGTC